MGHAQLSLQPLVSAARLRQILQNFNGETVLRKVVPDSDNCLVRESSITCVNGNVEKAPYFFSSCECFLLAHLESSFFDPAKLRTLRPSFKQNEGSVTAGNASIISYGAAALVLVSGEKALQLGLQVIAKIKGYADAAQAPEFFTTAPALVIPKAISNAGLDASQIDYYEINEAFSVVALANQKLLGLNPESLNVHGGAVSLEHPLGCSGARILVTLLGVLRHKKGKYGVGAI
ncbi:acetyl-CoA acetyltransferase 1-like [Humulus lupulus]|uniref:acetyl-CoA acetyltransferase 1-like n=1 Tax=Humulus lupulus TaxID=3486 RepID=UPI002B416C1F|nr:acetyl-CoA acetyltransferase 1-like [Humulus lupulus]